MIVSQYNDYGSKKQDREAIRQILKASRASISEIKKALEADLEDSQGKMKKFASKTTASNLQEGLVGEAADAAVEYLNTDPFHPTFDNPIKK